MHTLIIIYAYTQRIYSSRQIAKAVRQNIMSMWIAGRQRPDFRTINRVSSERMKTALETVFTAVLQFPVVYVCLGEGCLEAEAQLQEKVRTLFVAIEEAEKQEEGKHGGRIFFLTFISMRLMKRF